MKYFLIHRENLRERMTEQKPRRGSRQRKHYPQSRSSNSCWETYAWADIFCILQECPPAKAREVALQGDLPRNNRRYCIATSDFAVWQHFYGACDFKREMRHQSGVPSRSSCWIVYRAPRTLLWSVVRLNMDFAGSVSSTSDATGRFGGVASFCWLLGWNS
jgi:hypothetical protein